MKKILFSILILFSINGFAFNWVKLEKNLMGGTIYVDLDNIDEFYNVIHFPVLFDYAGVLPSEIEKYLANCEEKILLKLSNTSYSEPMGKGTILEEDFSHKKKFGYIYPKTGSIHDVLMKFACNNAK